MGERSLMVTSTVQQRDDVNGFFAEKIENAVGKSGQIQATNIVESYPMAKRSVSQFTQ